MTGILNRLGLSAVCGNRRGAVAVVGAMGLLVITAGTFLATDLTRLHIARERLQSAADAAMLAAARELEVTRLQAETAARAVFDANMPDDFLGLDIAEDGFELNFESRHNALGIDDTVTLAVRASLPLFVAGLGDWLRPPGLSIKNLSVRSAAVKQIVGAEVVMVLDNTGSMKSGGKIQALRSAAAVLTESLFVGRETVPNLVVGMVNYASTVNIGTQHVGWLDPSAQVTLGADFAPSSWKGCVMARGALDETDAMIDMADPTTVLRPFLWESSYWDNGEGEMLFDEDVEISNSSCRSSYGDNASCNIWPDASGAVDERQSRENAGYGPNLGCPAPLVPLTPSRAEIMAGVADIINWHRGGTFSNVGLAWGWRMLSPEWQGQWRRPDDGSLIGGLPYGYEKRFNHKIIVLMTDGSNQIFKHDFTAYGVDGEHIPAGGIDASMTRLCTAIKDEGIVLYTVTFGSTNSSIETLFRNCASNPASETRLAGPFYFDAPSNADLVAVFRDIGGQIQDLRLIE